MDRRAKVELFEAIRREYQYGKRHAAGIRAQVKILPGYIEVWSDGG